MITAYDIYDAAFDSAQSEYSERTISYIVQYAESVFNVYLTSDIAQKILDAIDKWESNDCGGDNKWHDIEKQLRLIIVKE